jgi:hypothetical protein
VEARRAGLDVFVTAVLAKLNGLEMNKQVRLY